MEPPRKGGLMPDEIELRVSLRKGDAEFLNTVMRSTGLSSSDILGWLIHTNKDELKLWAAKSAKGGK
jgi:hypothetical protein